VLWLDEVMADARLAWQTAAIAAAMGAEPEGVHPPEEVRAEFDRQLNAEPAAAGMNRDEIAIRRVLGVA
jgi:hypothetical protein